MYIPSQDVKMTSLGSSWRKRAVPSPRGPFTVDATLPVEKSVVVAESPVEYLVKVPLGVGDFGLRVDKELRSIETLSPSDRMV